MYLFHGQVMVKGEELVILDGFTLFYKLSNTYSNWSSINSSFSPTHFASSVLTLLTVLVSVLKHSTTSLSGRKRPSTEWDPKLCWRGEDEVSEEPGAGCVQAQFSLTAASQFSLFRYCLKDRTSIILSCPHQGNTLQMKNLALGISRKIYK